MFNWQITISTIEISHLQSERLNPIYYNLTDSFWQIPTWQVLIDNLQSDSYNLTGSTGETTIDRLQSDSFNPIDYKWHITIWQTQSKKLQFARLLFERLQLDWLPSERPNLTDHKTTGSIWEISLINYNLTDIKIWQITIWQSTIWQTEWPSVKSDWLNEP